MIKRFFSQRLFSLLSLTILLGACEANHGVAIMDNWVRANAPGQSVGAAYMTLLSAQDSTMIKAEADVAGAVEIHSMKMENGVMKMRMLEELPLKAGKTEKLAPGGFHLMLFDLKKPLTAGEVVNFTLSFKDAAGNITKQQVTMPIKAAD
ncbi:MAG TPA: copper chaperone PCu(A)C [Methylotenera sp.]|nr:copper chaperone PCu(A)C [Methylotenera sp.]